MIMNDGVIVMDMSGIYKNDSPLFEYVKSKYTLRWFDCRDVRGTECYCDDEAYKTLNRYIKSERISVSGIHYIDNGNYHYLSKIFLDNILRPFDLLVIDNHPDMQTPVFGPILSCGSWVNDLLKDNSFIRRVCLYGVKKELVTQEMRDDPKVFFAEDISDVLECIDRDTDVYISIDKDVLDTGDYLTNWDQGNTGIDELEHLLSELAGMRSIYGVDICGHMDLSMSESNNDAYRTLNDNTDIRILKALEA